MNKVTALIVAAGEGRRFGGAKVFTLLGGKTILERSLESFETHASVDAVVLVLKNPGFADGFAGRFDKLVAVVAGGEQRQDSVWNGFRKIRAGEGDFVLVHDGARPFADRELIDRVLGEARRVGAAVPAVGIEDTVKEVREGRVVATPGRSNLFRVQTPQGFAWPVLNKALESAMADGFYGTDESMLVERIGAPVGVVDGNPRNIKITTPLDLTIAEAFLE